jgi:hypothetical protein
MTIEKYKVVGTAKGSRILRSNSPYTHCEQRRRFMHFFDTPTTFVGDKFSNCLRDMSFISDTRK